MKYSNACEVFALATRGKFRTETRGITYKAPTKNVLWTSVIVLDSVGLAQGQEKTLCLGNMRTSAYLLLFPVNKSHRQFYDSWKIDDPEPRPWNRQLQNSCRPDDEKRFHVIFIALMLVVNLYIFCNGMESFSKNKKKQSICNLFYRFLKGFLDKIELW